MSEHYFPKRGDAVEKWLKQRRDEYPKPESGTIHLIGMEWTALDNLLDDYRWAADTGQTLVAFEKNREYTDE